jgi:hypothetical protein
MLKEKSEINLTKYLALGMFLISATVTTEGLTDPVNVPKFLLLGIFSLSALGILFEPKVKRKNRTELILKILLGLLMVCMFTASAMSASPFSQSVYGSYGRNSGILTYLFLSILVWSGSQIHLRENHYRLLKSLILVGYINLAYCLWVILFGDFIPWSNPYGNILGTFGNPNFIGAFLGMFFGVLLAIGVGSESSRRFKISLIPLLLLTAFEIVDSHAIQGRVLAALSVAIVGFFFLRFKSNPIITGVYTVVCVALGSLALAGAFQKGPLVDMIYKTSVSLRGQYWLAAWNTGQENPIFGVGMDGFGDWYRRARDIRAIELPGVNTVVNTAHNVPLDMFAFGGWPLLIIYILIMGLALKSLVRIAIKMQRFDSVAVGLITAWICYQVQSIISINQIGLAVWGWILSGLLIGYEKHSDNSDQISNSAGRNRKSIQKAAEPKTILIVAALGFLGFILALPPVTADVTLRSAQVSQDVVKLENTMKSGYFNPQNTQKFLLNIQAFESNGLFSQAHTYALKAVKWNPESYELWRVLYIIKESTPGEKENALQNMKKLDPLNPDLTAK